MAEKRIIWSGRWQGKSAALRLTLEIAKKLGIPVHVVQPTDVPKRDSRKGLSR